jgi:hypothetical protein
MKRFKVGKITLGKKTEREKTEVMTSNPNLVISCDSPSLEPQLYLEKICYTPYLKFLYVNGSWAFMHSIPTHFQPVFLVE